VQSLVPVHHHATAHNRSQQLIQRGVRNGPTEQKEVAENDSGQRLVPPVTLNARINGGDAKGEIVRFGEYWVSAVQGKIEVTAGEFDDTELSDHSDWQEGWQNEDPDYLHGLIDPLTMLHDISKKIAGELDAEDLGVASAKFREGIPCPVNDLHDLAMLIQLLIPKVLPRSAMLQLPNPSLTNDGVNIPFGK
jgi:hypothetical protein